MSAFDDLIISNVVKYLGYSHLDQIFTFIGKRTDEEYDQIMGYIWGRRVLGICIHNKTVLTIHKRYMSYYPDVFRQYIINLVDSESPDVEKCVLHYAEKLNIYAPLMIYINKFRKNNWPEAVELIRKNPRVSQIFITKHGESNYPELLQTILSDAHCAYTYIWKKRNFVRYIELEDTFRKNPVTMLLYALGYHYPDHWKTDECIKFMETGIRRVNAKANLRIMIRMNNEIPELMPKLLSIPVFAYHYAMDFKKERVPELENVILLHSAADLYAKKYRTERWEELENRLFEQGRLCLLVNYCDKFFDTRWPELEERLLSNGSANLLRRYAIKVMKCRWPEAEEKIFTAGSEAARYALNFRFRLPEHIESQLSDANFYCRQYKKMISIMSEQ